MSTKSYMFFTIQNGDVEQDVNDIFLLNSYIRDYHYWGNRTIVNKTLINLFYNVLECFGLGLYEQNELLEPIVKLGDK
mgnify:FL=1